MNLDLVKFRIISKRYSQVRAIMAELGESDTLLLRSLRDGFGIRFDSVKEDPELFFVQDSEQMGLLRESGIGSPTWLQILGTSRMVALSQLDADRKFRELIGDIEPGTN